MIRVNYTDTIRDAPCLCRNPKILGRSLPGKYWMDAVAARLVRGALLQHHSWSMVTSLRREGGEVMCHAASSRGHDWRVVTSCALL